MNQIKKISPVLITFLFTILPIHATVDNDGGNCGDNVTWEFVVQDSALYIQGSGEMVNDNKPWNKYRNYINRIAVEQGVTHIGNRAFAYFDNVTDVYIPASIKSIGEEAFAGCSNLTSIDIRDNVTDIGSYAFAGCSNLTSLTIPNSVKSIGEEAFSGCSNLTSVSISNSLTSLSYGLFYNCSSLASVIIPENVKSIGSNVFKNCSSLNHIIIPESVESIGEEGFFGCSNLTSVIIPENVKSIGQRTFYNCSSLSYVIIPENIESINDGIFYNCSSLVSITIPEAVTSIGMESFKNCTGLTSITIPENVKTIGQKTFSGCSNLTSVSIPKSTTVIEAKSFENCTKLSSITNKSLIPQSIESTVFSDSTIKNAVLSVFYNVVEDYKNAAVWKDFKQIKMIERDNALLKNIIISISDSIKHSLTSGSLIYTDTVPNSVDSVTIKAETEYSTTRVEGDLYDQGLDVGDNTFFINATSDDQSITREYTLKIRRLSKNTELKQIVIDVDGVEHKLETENNSRTYRYTVPNSVESITIHVDLKDQASILEGDGHKQLKVGDNPFTVVVKDEGRTHSTTYKIEIRRISDATLEKLTFEADGKEYHPLDKGNGIYTSTVYYPISNITILAEANPGDSIYGDLGDKTLVVGDNDFTIRIDPEDKSVTKEYQLKITRSNNTALNHVVNIQVDETLNIYNIYGRYLGVTERRNRKIVVPAWLGHGVFVAKGGKHVEKFIN